MAAPNKVLVGEYWSSSIALINGDGASINGRITVPGTPKSMIYVPSTQKVFSTDYLSNEVSALDARDGHEAHLVDVIVGSGPLAMACFHADPDVDRIFVANSFDSTVSVVRDFVGIAEPKSDRDLALPVTVRALPNPTSGRVHFEAFGFEPARLEVRDSDGRLVAAATGPEALSWQATARGVYFCRLGDGVRSAGCKLIVR